MGATRIAALLHVLVLSAAGAARADDGGLASSVTATIVAERHGFNQDRNDDNDDYYDLKNRLNLSLSGRSLAFALRIDTVTYAQAPDETYANDYRFERLWFRADGALASVIAGDFYVQFGRGIALALRKIDELGVDTALRGARLDLHLPSHWETTLVAGTTNIVNVDEVNRRLVPDPFDRIVGGRSEGRLGGAILGMHAVAMVPSQPRIESESDRMGNLGVDLSLPELPAGLSAHVEGDLQFRRIGGSNPAEGDTRHRPFALYADVAWAIGPLTLTAEGKNYYDFQALEGPQDPFTGIRYSYTQPPTAERTDQEVPSNSQIYGGRLRADFAIPSTTHGVFVNYAQSRTRTRELDASGYGLRDADAYHHAYGGAELRLAGGRTVTQVSFGHRIEQDIESEDVRRRMWHAEIDLTTSLFGPHGLHLSFTHQSWSVKDPLPRRPRRTYERGTAVADYDYGSRLAAGIGFEYDTEFDLEGVRKYFTFGDLRYTVSPAILFRAVVGQQRGGLKCVNGVCRTFPPFAGARAELVVRY